MKRMVLKKTEQIRQETYLLLSSEEKSLTVIQASPKITTCPRHSIALKTGIRAESELKSYSGMKSTRDGEVKCRCKNRVKRAKSQSTSKILTQF